MYVIGSISLKKKNCKVQRSLVWENAVFSKRYINQIKVYLTFLQLRDPELELNSEILQTVLHSMVHKRNWKQDCYVQSSALRYHCRKFEREREREREREVWQVLKVCQVFFFKEKGLSAYVCCYLSLLLHAFTHIEQIY